MRRLALLALSAALMLAACGGQGSGGSGGPASAAGSPTTTATTTTPIATATSTTATSTTATATTATAAHHRPRRRAPDPGRLPQTPKLPSSTSHGFHREMHSLWSGIRSGHAGRALSAFFPEAAYVQIKSIGDAQGDWHNRLVAAYAGDIGAAHSLLGGGARRAKLVAVHVPAGYAHWVTPGVCDNRVGYWETPNSRVVYRQAGQVRSFGIASMISWRGVWYVVHLGAVLRTGAGGVVDDPSSGTGYAAPSSTC